MNKSVVDRIQDLLNENYSLIRSLPKDNISIALGVAEQESAVKEFVNITGMPYFPGTRITEIVGHRVIDVQKESYLGIILGVIIEEVTK